MNPLAATVVPFLLFASVASAQPDQAITITRVGAQPSTLKTTTTEENRRWYCIKKSVLDKQRG
jgi:hypothetical protein